MTFFGHLLLTGVLLLAAALYAWIFIRSVDRATLPMLDDCWPLITLHPPSCTITDARPADPERADRDTECLVILNPMTTVRRWACGRADCSRIHRTPQGAEFCSLTRFDAAPKHPAVEN